MATDSEGFELKNGDLCLVVGGTHRGKSGYGEAINTSKTGVKRITVRQANNERFKTLAKNVRAKTDAPNI